MTAQARPLVSVVVPVFRHQPYLGPALKSILALDYNPLEIIIQDDASPDDAFEVIQAIVGAYTGSHIVKIGKNETNLSMGNFNVLMDKASSDYIVVAHDDDIQFPDRVSMLINAFLEHGVSMVTSSTYTINESGSVTGSDKQGNEDKTIFAEEFSRLNSREYCHGATLSWHRSIFDKFGPIDVLGTARTSDFIIPFRASLINGIHYLNSPTMYRRIHHNSRGHIGRNSNDINILQAEKASEHITQWVYILSTLRQAVHDDLIDASRTKNIEPNVIKAILREADTLARSRNTLHMRKKRMAWIDHDEGALTQLDIVSDPVTSDNKGAMLPKRNRCLEAIYRPRWYHVALKYPLQIKRWIEAWRWHKRPRS